MVYRSTLSSVEPYSPMAADYDEPVFWDERYMEYSDVFEWYVDYEALRNLVPKPCRTLIAGCGTSTVGTEMVKDGYDVLNVDVSRVLIDLMSHKEGKWKQMDLRHSDLENESFDLVVDKALFDAITSDAYLQEMDRILTPTGTFLCVSHAPPDIRLEALYKPDGDDCLAWTVDVVRLDRAFAYVCTKSPKLHQAKLNDIERRRKRATSAKPRKSRKLTFKIKKRGMRLKT